MKSVTTYDEYLFDQINTPAKAYFLGLMYADGCVYHTVNSKNKTDYRTSICLQETDKTILERFRKELE